MTLKSKKRKLLSFCWGSSNFFFHLLSFLHQIRHIFFYLKRCVVVCCCVACVIALPLGLFLGHPRRFARCAVWILRWKRLRFHDDVSNPILPTLLFYCDYEYYSNIRQMIVPAPDSTPPSSSIGRRIHIQAPCATRNLGAACRMHMMHHVSSLCCGPWSAHTFGGFSTCGANWQNCVDMDGSSL